jgi:hypothetical protein
MAWIVKVTIRQTDGSKCVSIATDVKDAANAIAQAKARNPVGDYDWDNAEVDEVL